MIPHKLIVFCKYYIYLFLFLFVFEDFPRFYERNPQDIAFYSPRSLYVQAVWTGFDLVKPRKGAWGSNGTTSFYRIERPIPVNKTNDNGAGAKFGQSICNLGDLDNNGYDDIAVGASGEKVQNKTNAGGVYIFLMGENGTYLSYNHINGLKAREPQLSTGDQFGYSLACIGDLNNDGIYELAVGAPGTVISSVYILYIYKTGVVLNYRLIRGKYVSPTTNTTLTNSTTTFNQSYPINGPPIVYGSRFGSALAFMDINPNYYYQLAVASLGSSGENVVYLLYLNITGWVQTYATLTPSQAGITSAYSNFGSSITFLPKIRKNDLYYTIVIGASKLYEVGSINTDAGSVFIFYITANGTVNSTRLISETSSQDIGVVLPFKPYEGFGTALTTVGDINRDHYGQKHPDKLNWKNLPSIPDIIIGAPQSQSSGGTGRLYLIYPSEKGKMNGYTVLPSTNDLLRTNISLDPYEQFGASISYYQDLDKNQLKEILVGSPNRKNSNSHLNTGAFYILFPRRRRYHPGVFDWVSYYLIICVPTGFCCFSCMGAVAYFCWYFRRRPDEVEIIVKKSGLIVDPSKPRQKYVKQNTVYIEEYPV